MKIIVGQDFSNGAKNAIEHAKIWADKLNGEIVLVHSFVPTMVDPNYPIGMIDKLQLSITKEKEELLKESVSELTNDRVKASYCLIMGDIKYAIEEAVKTEKADLVILGKANNPDFFERLIGTTSKHLINNINVPLLVIPELFKPKPLTSIIYASEFEYDETSNLTHSKSIIDAFKAELRFVNVEIANDIIMEPDMELLTETLIKVDLKNAPVEYYKAKSLRVGLSRAIADFKADLCIVVSHKRGVLDTFFSPSQSKKLISTIDVPILVYHFS